MPHSEARNPRFLNALAYLLWSFPLTYILVIGSLYNLNGHLLARIFFSFYYILHSIIAVGTGVALKKMRPYSWHLFLFHSFLLAVEQFVLAFGYAEDHIPQIPLTLALATIAGIVFLLKLELRVPYYSPKIAWWESDPRYKISVPAQMTCSDHFYKGDIMDISSSGAFIKTKDPMKVDQSIIVKFALFESQFEITGKVVWRTESGVTHPKGVGVRFLGLEKIQTQQLRETVKKLKNLNRSFKHLRAEEKASTMERKVQQLSQRKG